jgi:hypothetical protein
LVNFCFKDFAFSRILGVILFIYAIFYATLKKIILLAYKPAECDTFKLKQEKSVEVGENQQRQKKSVKIRP